MKPKLLIVSMSTLHRDVRVLRHIAALNKHFRVVTAGYGHKPLGSEEHLEIPHNLSYLPLNVGALVPHVLRRFSRSSQRTPAIKFLAQWIREQNFEGALLNDVQSLPLMEHIKSPVIVDMHEYAPREMDDDWRFRIYLMRYYTWLCARYLPRARAVTTVSRYIANEFSREFDVQVQVIMNAREGLELPIKRTERNELRLVHTGLASRSRRLETMIDAVADQPGLRLDMYLMPAPRQPRTLRALERRARTSNNVRVLPPVPSEHLPNVINTYDASLVYLAPDSFSVKYSLPNKVFDSIQARVGIICGPSPEISDFCEKYEVGIATAEFSSESLRALLSSLDLTTVNSWKVKCEIIAREITAKREGLRLSAIVAETIACNTEVSPWPSTERAN